MMSEEVKFNSPPQFLVLLWHHCCYYKRHWLVLAFTLLLPLLFIALLTVVATIFTNGKLTSLVQLAPNGQIRAYYAESSISSGPFAMMLSNHCQRKASYLLSVGKPTSDRSMLDSFLRDPKFCTAPQEFASRNFADYSWPSRSECECENYGYEGYWICHLIRSQIVYYPHNIPDVDRVVEKIVETLDNYSRFFQLLPDNVHHSDPFIQRLLGMVRKFKKCPFPPGKSRLIGSATEAEALVFLRNVSASSDLVWGIVGFTFVNGGAVQFKITHHTSERESEREVALLQDLVEHAILVSKGVPSLGKAVKRNPEKCWNIPVLYIYNMMAYLLPFAVVMSFLMPAANFLTQVLMEKRLKLREYLYIMGVGPWKLKISWMCFYLFFLVPMIIIWCLVIRFLPGPILGRADGGLIFLLLLFYNVAQLAFCYLLSSFLQSEERTGVLISFLHIFFWILTLVSTPTGGGKSVVFARVTSLYPTVPLHIAINYILAWEEIWVGAVWKNGLDSPFIEDSFHGIGECFLWLTADTLLFLFLAWYCENVFPGEFGVKQPFYFPLLPSYWLPRAAGPYEYVTAESEAAVIEQDHSGSPGIVLRGLSKLYGRDKVGIRQLSMTFNENEVTAFLGENGAGKSTTMNILVGLISKTSGSATVIGLDVSEEIGAVRKLLGFVPQYDILYPSMTVEEHLQFYGWLKGMSRAEIRAGLGPILDQLGLDAKTITTNLSGGQKRKLSIMTAFLREPRAVILDEPTSGVDPFSRRAIWDMILARRRSATIILSTHHMQEADFLGDRVAIISEGELRAFGTPMFLKNRLGDGLQLVVAADTENVTGILDFMRGHGLVFAKQTGSDLFFRVPNRVAQSEAMVEFLRALEERQRELEILSFGLSESTMEQVFFKSISRSEEGLNAEDVEEEETSDRIEFVSKSGPWAALYQVEALGLKKFYATFFSPSTYLLQIVLPLTFVVLLLMSGERIGSLGQDPDAMRVGIWQSYLMNKIAFQSDTAALNKHIRSSIEDGLGPRCPGRFCGKSIPFPADFDTDPNPIEIRPNCACVNESVTIDMCNDKRAIDQLHRTAPSSDVIYRIGSGTRLTDWILHANETFKPTRGAVQEFSLPIAEWEALIGELGTGNWAKLVKETTKTHYAVIWHPKGLQNGMGNVWSNMELKAHSGPDSTIQFILSEKLPFHNAIMYQVLSTIVGSVFLDFCFAFATFGIASLVQFENTSGMKRFQLMCGTSPALYHCVNLVFDFVLYMLTVAVVMVFLAAFTNSYSDSLGTLCQALVPYGLLSIAFTYVLSFAFRNTKGIVIFSILAFVVSFFAGMIIPGLELECDGRRRRQTDCAAPWTIPVAAVLRIIPSYYVVDSVLIVTLSKLEEIESL